MFLGIVSKLQHHGHQLLIGVVLIMLFACSPLLPASFQLIRTFLLTFSLLYNAYILGTYTFPRFRSSYAVLPSFILILALQSILQSACYYANLSLGNSTDLLVQIISTVLIHAGLICFQSSADAKQNSSVQENDVVKPEKSTIKNVFGYLIAGITLLLSVHVLQQATHAATIDSIRTPWPLFPPTTLVIFAAMWLLFAIAILWIQRQWLTVFQSIITLFTTLSLAPLVYKIGFGFDGFLHIASEKILLTTGTLHPKPFYYIGQYVFTTWVARISQLPVPLIDRWLVPVAASVIIPLSLLLAIRSRQKGLYIFFILGLLPLGSFASTTPQAFAYVLGLSALFLTYGCLHDELHPLAPLLILGWTIVVHPLAGIPLFFVACAILASRIDQKAWRILIRTLAVLLSTISIPLLFFIISSQAGTAIAWNIDPLVKANPWIHALQSLNPLLGYTSTLWPAWSTFALRVTPIILFLFSLVGITYASGRQRAAHLSWILSAIGLWIAAAFLKTTGDFSFLIDYERGNYADRLYVLSLFTLLPAVLPFFLKIGERAPQMGRLPPIGLTLFFIAFATAGTYNSLPRHDALVVGHGWSTSAADIEAVKLIERDANGHEYIVLANQSVSAAAVATLGFKRYIDDIFFYPIPTGGALYELFLRMTYQEPSRETIYEAAQLGKTDLVYVVLNDYWWRADTLSESIQHIASRDWNIRDGKVRVYKFDLAEKELQ